MKKILIVDDSKTARMVVKRCLEITGFRDATFLEAVNGKEALNLLKQEPADLVVTDLNMPVMDGETFLKWVKGSPKTHDIPVVMISSARNAAKEKQILDMGALAVIGKPVSPELLKQSIGYLLEEEDQWGQEGPVGDDGGQWGQEGPRASDDGQWGQSTIVENEEEQWGQGAPMQDEKGESQ
jgi:two-component system chemotaxis response regulator CheY